jgi:hypothetical protein
LIEAEAMALVRDVDEGGGLYEGGWTRGLYRAVQRGWLAVSHDMRGYRVTTQGRDEVCEGFYRPPYATPGANERKDIRRLREKIDRVLLPLIERESRAAAPRGDDEA